MKGKRSKLLLVLALVVVSALCLYTACNKNGDNGKTEVTITLGEKTEYELDLYEQVTLKATVTGTDEAVQWKTSDATVATVENGTVTALKAGTATITATVAEKSATCSVKVTPSGAVPMIVGVNSSVTLKYGTNTKVTPQAEYKGNAIDVTFTYESENPEIATVENGTITAVKVGTTTVYVRATYYNYNMEEEIAVTVRDDVSMSLDVSELTLAISEPTADFHKTHQLTADITENGQPVTDMSKVTYKSSDDTSVIVSEEGLVTALKIPESGSVTVTASYTSTNNDKFDAFVIVTVIKPEVAVVPDSAIVAEINADTEENMELSLAALGEYGVTADKVTAITDVAKNAVVEFTVSEGKLMLKKSTVWSGEREFRVETADASFKLPVTMITKILNTAADLDK